MRLQLKRSNVLASGSAKTPTASQLEYGELAINYNTDDPAIFLKDSNNNVIRISGVGNIADDGQVELPATTTPPSNPQSGNLWYNSDDGRLYIYYTDADSSQWVDASPDSWDPTVLPDTTNSSSQSGTLDDRYLMLNSGNDPITGGLNITSGDVGIGTSSAFAPLHVRRNAVTNPPTRNATLYLEDTENVEIQMVGTTKSQIRFGTSGSSGNGLVAYDYGSEYMYFSTDGSERMRINSSGNVGIGTTSATSPLHVIGDIKTEGAFLALPFSGSSEGGEIQLKNPDGTTNGAIIDVSAANTFRIFQLANNSLIQLGQLSGTGGTITLHTSGQERFRVDSVGNCGIGTSAPITDLTVRGVASATEGGNLCIQNTGSGLNTSVALYLTPNNGGGNDLQRTAAIKSRQDVAGNFANLEFYTSESNTPAERMRITSSGIIRIGQTSSNDPSGNGVVGVAIGPDYISCNGNQGNAAVFGRTGSNGSCVLFRRHTINVGSISVNSSSTSYNTSSDHRLKENVVDLDGAITRVKQLAPKRFNFIADADTTVDGFLAHEAQTVVPEAVTGTQDEMEDIGTLTEWDGTVLETDVVEPDSESLTWEETTTDEEGNQTVEIRIRTWTYTGSRPVYQGIDQAKLVPLLTAALQEAIARIEALENA